MADERITWVRGKHRRGPRERIGVLEARGDGGCRAALAERAEVDGRCHVRLAVKAWGRKDSLETRCSNKQTPPSIRQHRIATNAKRLRSTSTDLTAIHTVENR